MIDKSQQILAGIRAKVEHPFRVIKRQFGFTKLRYRGLKTNAAQVQTLFALSSLWMARRNQTFPGNRVPEPICFSLKLRMGE